MWEKIKYYDFFILDIWGVIHDGTSPYPMVLETLQKLKNDGKKVMFLSNAPRRAEKVKQALEFFGITRDLYVDVVTSGEAGVMYTQKILSSTGKKSVFYIGPERDLDVLNGVDCEVVNEVELINSCGVAILTGFVNDDGNVESNRPYLEACFAKDMEILCLNPDLIVVKQTGVQHLCAGWLAREYKEMGGKIVEFGKPFNPVYEMVYQKLGMPDKSKVVAIGDSIENDIKGAADFGFDSVLVTSGIHKKDILKIRDSDEVNLVVATERFLSNQDVRPKYYIELFCDVYGS